MNFKELVKATSEKSGFAQGVVETVVSGLFDTVRETVVAGQEVKINKFGRFYPVTLAARDYVHKLVDEDSGEITKEKVTKPPRPTMKFKTSNAIRREMEK